MATPPKANGKKPQRAGCVLNVNKYEKGMWIGVKITEKMKIFFIFIIIVFFWLTYGLIINLYPLEQKGIYGDMFGGLTALFSGLAFAGIILTIRFQIKELELQREELSLQRKETARLADAQEKIVITSRIQNRIEKHKIKISCWEAEMNYLSIVIGSFGANSKFQTVEIIRVEKLLMYMQEEIEVLVNAYEDKPKRSS